MSSINDGGFSMLTWKMFKLFEKDPALCVYQIFELIDHTSGSPPPKPEAEENGYLGQANLLDLSDDVLLYILRYCSPHDLKALGYCCPRLGALVLERSLWSRVDSRDVCSGPARAAWLLDYALHAGTQALLLTGFARQAEGCQGHVNRTRLEAVEDSKHWRDDHSSSDGFLSEHEVDESSQPRRREPPLSYRNDLDSSRLNMSPLHHMPRLSSSPCWPDSDSDDSVTDCDPGDRCLGPVFTLGRNLLKRLRLQCPNLTTLHLEYCNINCNKTALSNFPPTLKRLSLKGTRCYNLPLDKSYLFKIHDYLPVLEYLELSACGWLEPATLLPLSKLPRLRTLLMRDCAAMHEFVAYVSLATRYGFRKLEVLDFRGSPVGDSEVAALGWLAELRELYLSAPPPAPAAPPPSATHRHYRGDRRARPKPQGWERQVPDYYAISRYQDISAAADVTPESAITSVKFMPNSLNIPQDLEREETGDRKRKTENGNTDHEAGPSKRPKESDINTTIANIQNSKTSVTKNNGFVTFRRTIFNNVTDINKSLNSESDDEETRKKDEQEDEKKTPNDEETPKENDKESSEDNKESPSENNLANRVNIAVEVDDGASTSSVSVRFRFRNFEERESPSNKDEKVEDVAEVTADMEADNEPPAKKIRLEPDSDYQNKSEKMSTDESSSDGQSESMDVNVAESNNDDLNRSFGSFEGQSSRGSSYTDKSEPNVSSLVSSCSNSQGASSTLTGHSVEGPSQSGSNHASSIASRLSRLRRSVGLDANPIGSSPKANHVGYRSSSSNQEGSSPSNDLNRRIPAPSMEGPSRPSADRSRSPPQYVRFRRNQDPVIIQCPARQEEQAEPRHHVLYVNLGQQLHAVYRLLPSRPMFHSRSRSLSTERMDSSTLVTDSAIRRFGRADGEDVNIVNIGPNGPQFGGRDTSGRPNRSNLRILSATGYRNITNRSLVHLATAAPFLQSIDFTDTGVTENGVEHFRGLRPDCQVTFSEFEEHSDED